MNQYAETGIDIVIPNWNGRAMLATCLSSLDGLQQRNCRVIVVDNGSTDESVTYVQTRFPWVDLVCLPENRGFSAAVNAGIRAGTNPWVLLLNNDTEMHSGCVDTLRRHACGDERYDMFALKMIGFEHRHLLDGAGDGVLRGGVGYRLGTLEHDGPAYALRRDVFGACAGAALYRRALFARIGLFDEDFFAYLEDVDFNFRAVRAGANCCYLPEAMIYHIGSASSGSKTSAFVIRLSTRNNLFVIAKHYSWRLLLRFLPALLVYQLFWLLFVIKKGQVGAYFQGVGQAVPKIPAMIRKRRDRRDTVTIPERDFARRIIASERQVIHSIMSRRTQQGKGNRLLHLYLRCFC